MQGDHVELGQAWRQMNGFAESVAADEEQVEAAKIAFEGSHTEGKLGLRTTLDVLIAEQDLYGAEIALTAARRDHYAAQTALLVATGALQPEILSAAVILYDPVKHFKHISRLRPWAPWEPALEAADRLTSPGERRPVAGLPRPR